MESASAPRSRAPKPRSPSDPGRTTFSTAASTAPGARETDYDSSMHVIDIVRVMLTLLVFTCSMSLVSTGDLVFWGYGPWYTRPAEVRKYVFGS
jgi:hypothetical protein